MVRMALSQAGNAFACRMLRGGNVQDKEWAGGGEQWNLPTTRVIEANGSYSFGVRLLTAPSLAQLDSTLLKAGKAVVRGVPGKQPPPPGLRLLNCLCSCHAFNCRPAAPTPVLAAGYVVATDMDVQLLVTLPNQAIPLTHVLISPEGAMVAGEAQPTRCRPLGPVPCCAAAPS